MWFLWKLMTAWPLRVAPWAVGLFLSAATLPAAPASRPPTCSAAAGPAASFNAQITPLLEKYCFSCHGHGKKKGDLMLDAYTSVAGAANDPHVWQKVLENLRTRVMPPEKKPQPSDKERELLVRWIETEVFHCDCNHPDPGRVTLRRLNRTEYNNTIRDLVGVKFQPAEVCPADDSGYGFDNIGDVLSLPPVLMEKYLAAATRILDAALLTEDPRAARLRRFDAADLEGSAPGEAVESGGRRLAREGDIKVQFHFPAPGEYILRARAYGEQFGPDPARMTLSLGTNLLRTFDVPVEAGNSQAYEVRCRVEAGSRPFAAAYINNLVNQTDKDPKKRGDRNLIVEYLEIEGPVDRPLPPVPETHRRVFFRDPTPTNHLDYAREALSRFAARAYRRPVQPGELDRLMVLVRRGLSQHDTFEQSVKTALSAVLISPHFLFRGEMQPEPDNPKSTHLIGEYALAARLSYFLWSSLPDEELSRLAEAGRLRKELAPQVRRMLRDPRAQALVDNFAGQWLQLRNLRIVTPDAVTFPGFDEPLRAAMETETQLFFEHILRGDRSVLEFLNGDYSFVNERLARHYGLPGVQGPEFRKVSLRRTGRGGILTQGAILTLTSNPTRTSPVKRGKYVLENLLGTPPPPPPPNVPELKEVKLTGSLRQRLEQHRENALCASCHSRMDPLGFGLENFDGIGAWRTKDGQFPIDPAGQLVSGESFKGASDLTAILAKSKRPEFVRCLSEKMLIYALGRGLEFYDKCAVESISRGLAGHHYRFSALILEIVNSVPFQQRRGDRVGTVATSGTATPESAAGLP